MDYKEEAIECVKGNVLQMHKQIYAKYNGDFDRIYTEAYNNASYMGKVIKPGKEYELIFLECSCPKVKSGQRSNPEQCECSRQSIFLFSRNLNLTANSMSVLRIRFFEERPLHIQNNETKKTLYD